MKAERSYWILVMASFKTAQHVCGWCKHISYSHQELKIQENMQKV